MTARRALENRFFDLVDCEKEWQLVGKLEQNIRAFTLEFTFFQEKVPVLLDQSTKPSFGRPLEIEDRTTSSRDTAINRGEYVVAIR